MQSDVGNRAVPSPLIEVPFVGFHCTFTTATDATMYTSVCVCVVYGDVCGRSMRHVNGRLTNRIRANN